MIVRSTKRLKHINSQTNFWTFSMKNLNKMLILTSLGVLVILMAGDSKFLPMVIKGIIEVYLLREFIPAFYQTRFQKSKTNNKFSRAPTFIFIKSSIEGQSTIQILTQNSSILLISAEAKIPTISDIY